MPVFFEKRNEDYTLTIWSIEEDYKYLYKKARLSDDEKLTVNKFKSQQRKFQYLTTRVIVKEIFKNDAYIVYNENGQPQLTNNLNISISHTKNYAAVIISQYNVGIDIELLDKKIFRIMHRFLSIEEQNYLNTSDELSLFLCWGAKESMVKITNNKNYIYNRDLKILEFEAKKEGNFKGQIDYNKMNKQLNFNYKLINNVVFVWSIDI